MTDEVVTRLYRSLVEELEERGHREEYPIKVSELYQTLVPYGAVRSRLGVELNADYEHALLRLLAGERGLLRLEPAEYRDELQREVEAPYPFVGLFRKFSAADVWIKMPESREEPAPPREAPPARSPADAPAEPDHPTLRSAGGAEPAPARPAVQLHPVEGSEPVEREPVERRDTAARDCLFCGDELPAGRRVRFCPHCGGDQRLRPCPRCEAVLERDWRYCISCGAEPSAS